MDDLFSDAVRQLLGNQCTPAVVRQIEAGASPAALWRHIEEAGFADALVPEDRGGAGLSLTEVYPVLELCGSHAVAVPLAETVLARAALASAGIAIPKGSIAIAQGRASEDGSLVCACVQGARVTDWVLVDTGAQGVLLPAAQAVQTRSGFVLDAGLSWTAGAVAAATTLPDAPEAQLLLACLNAAQLAGAMQAVFNRTLQYANDRNQFGRPIGKFQAIQHQLSVMAEQAFASRMAAQIGCRSATGRPDRLRVAVAKARTSEAVVEVAALSHSIHGAIGFTAEFDLQLFTRRLHAWRLAGGSESYWHSVVGAMLVDHPGLALDLIRTATDVA
ncbi:MAG: acyl-CoA dehydrogenase [Sulfuricaulis sp.]|nr:acyl-CoA dehydrogenase [Sulfuricaulis sp.]